MEDTVELKRPKLLVADDSVTIRKVVELTFAEEGIDVFAAGDGESAMKKFVEVEPDIVLVDVNMPDPTGYQICEMIKQDETTRELPVLLLVGSFEPFDTAEAEHVGADGFLTKPFQSVRELVARVGELLGNDNGTSAPTADTTDIDGLLESSFSETYRTQEEGSADAFLGDAGMDDDLIETSHIDRGPEPVAITVEQDASVEALQGYDWMSEPAADPETSALVFDGEQDVETFVDKRIKEQDAPVLEPTSIEFEDTLEVEEPADAGHEASSFEHLENLEPEDEDLTTYEPSEEFINIITRRVLEKLSDTVVREIAREAVPRITEKLIREALDTDKKSGKS